MKKKIRLCIVLLLALALNAGAALSAEAAKIQINNRHSQPLSVAAHYYYNGQWRTKGWFNVSPHSKRDITLNTSSSTVYIHSYLGDGTKWGKDLQKYVINGAFEYAGDGAKNCPRGSNRRVEKFTKYTADSRGVIEYAPIVTR